MKQFIGVLFALVGAVATLWSGYHVAAGESEMRIEVVRDFSVGALTIGLFGVGLLTVGLLWLRE